MYSEHSMIQRHIYHHKRVLNYTFLIVLTSLFCLFLNKKADALFENIRFEIISVSFIQVPSKKYHDPNTTKSNGSSSRLFFGET